MIYWRATRGEVWFRGEKPDQLFDLTTGEKVPDMTIAAWVNSELLRRGYERIEIRNDTRMLLRSYPPCRRR